MTDVRYWIWLSTILGPGSKQLLPLLKAFGDPKSVYAASEEKLKEHEIPETLISRLSDKNTDETVRIYEYCKRNGIKVIPYEDDSYPERLRRIDKPPVLLYVLGDLPDVDENVCIATVGTRRYTEYGKREAYIISYDLASGGAIVVSGLARGIDSICHRGCIDASGKTIGVLGCGIDVIYPKENDELYAEVIRNGAIVTEYMPGTPPLGKNFPLRNRIISGLSLGTLVIEADAKSGALITAEYTIKQGRDLFSLPGKVGEINSSGTNALIKDGAKMVTDAIDVLEEYECLFPQKIRPENIMAARAHINIPRTMRIPRTGNGMQSVAEKKKPLDYGNERGKERSAGSPKVEKADDTPVNAPDLSGLDEKCIHVYSLLPSGADVSADQLVRDDIGISDILYALTMLEIKHLIKTAPGGKYRKA